MDQQVVLAPGQVAELSSGLAIRFVSVLGDSRCPGDALCILGGDAIVRMEITAGSTSVERDLHTANNEPALYRNVRIELVQLDPYPFSARPIEPGDYRATLKVSRR